MHLVATQRITYSLDTSSDLGVPLRKETDVTTSEILQRDRARKARQREERQGRRILRLPQVQTKTGKARASIYEGVEAGTFPKPVPLGRRAVGWLEDEVDDWIDACAAKRDAREAV